MPRRMYDCACSNQTYNKDGVCTICKLKANVVLPVAPQVPEAPEAPEDDSRKAKYKPKTCKNSDCLKVFLPSGPRSEYCDDCTAPSKQKIKKVKNITYKDLVEKTREGTLESETVYKMENPEHLPVPTHTVIVPFGDCPELLESLKAVAKAEFRDVPNQIKAIVTQYLKFNRVGV